jgi:hypothetical protein
MNILDFALGLIISITTLESVAIYKNLDGAYFSLVVGGILSFGSAVMTHYYHKHKGSKHE